MKGHTVEGWSARLPYTKKTTGFSAWSQDGVCFGFHLTMSMNEAFLHGHCDGPVFSTW